MGRSFTGLLGRQRHARTAKRLQVGDYGERKHRKCSGQYQMPIAQMSTGEKIMRFLEAERFWQFDCCVFPQFADRWKTDARGGSRHNNDDPFVRELPSEANATFRECAGGLNRRIFAAPKQVRMLPTKSCIAVSHCSLGWIQLVLIFASLRAFAM